MCAGMLRKITNNVKKFSLSLAEILTVRFPNRARKRNVYNLGSKLKTHKILVAKAWKEKDAWNIKAYVGEYY